MKKLALLAFAVLSIGNGIYRITTDPAGGKTGLIFGLVMGAMAIAAALCVAASSRGARIAGHVVAALAIVMTGGFFVFALVSKPDEYGVARPLIMAVASVAAAAALLLGDARPDAQ